MQVGVLGQLDVTGGDASAPTRPKERAVVAFLALRAGRTAAVADLVDALWGEAPPATAVKSLQSYVARVRAAIGRDALVAAADGYRLAVEPDCVDAVRFERLLDSAAGLSAEGRAGECVIVLNEALALWRGTPYSDLPDSHLARNEAVRLTERHATALEDRMAARLLSGDHEWAVAEGEHLVGESPLRERRWSLLMRALYAAGRQSEALRAYQRLRTMLVDELGIEPSEPLRTLEAQVAAQDPTLGEQLRPIDVAESSIRIRPIDLPSGTVTFALTDIEGSTALWDRAPGRMADALMRHDELIAAAVASAGGILLKHKGEGDSTMSVFVTARAGVQAMVRAQRMLADERWPDECAIRVRAAVSTGEAEVRDGDYYGPAVNRAARIRSVAVGGQLVLGATTHALVADTLDPGWSIRSLGEHDLKGLRRPEHVWELCSEGRSAALPNDLSSPGSLVVPFPELLKTDHLTAFTGREDEIDLIARRIRSSREGDRRAVLIAGEPGIGKTRLAAEAALAAHRDGALVLYGRCDEDLAVPFQPFAEAVDYLASSLVGDLRGRLGTAPEELQRLAPNLVRIAPELGAPLCSDPETERYRLFDAVASLMASAGGGSGVVLVIDDLHWASKTTLLLLRHLLRTLPRSELCVIATYRDTAIDRSHPLSELLADLRRQPGVERLALVGLGAAEVETLVATVAGHDLDDEVSALAAMVHTETAGNPLFVGEVLRHLVESGTVQRRGGRWHLTDAPPVGLLPEGLKDVIGRHLSGLTGAANELATLASVLGRDFRLDILAAAAGRQPDELLDGLDELLDARLVEESGPDRYRFSHAVVRATLYDELRTSRRVRLHRAAGEAYEQHRPADLTALSHHFSEAAPAGDHTRAIRYTTAAAEMAIRQLAFAEAAELHQRALDLFDDSSDHDEVARCDLLLAVAVAQWFAGAGYEQPLAAATDLARSLGDGDRLAQCALLPNKGWYSVAFAVNEAFVALLEEVLELLPTADSPVRAKVLATLADELAFSGDTDRIRDLCDAAVDMVVRVQADPTIFAYVITQTMAATQGWPDIEMLAIRGQRAEMLRELLPLLDDPYLREGSAWSLLALESYAGRWRNLEQLAPGAGPTLGPQLDWTRSFSRAGLALVRGDHDGCERFTAASLVHGQETGNGDVLAVWANLTIYLRRQQGRPLEAVPMVQQIIDADAPGAFAWHTALAMLLTEGDASEDAGASLAIASRLYQARQQDYALLPVGAMLAAATADVDDRGVARWLYRQMLPHAPFVACWGLLSCLGPMTLSLGRLAACLGEHDEADAHFTKAVAWASAERTPYHHAEGLLYQATNRLQRQAPGDRETAGAQLDHGAAIAEALGFGTILRRIRQAQRVAIERHGRS